MGIKSYLSRLISRKKKKTGIVELQVGKYKLLADATHPIQDYLTVFKYYSRNIPRIARYIETKYPHYAIIDVGANIGDTLALLRSDGVDQQVYLFEGESGYFNLLERNLTRFTNVRAFETFLGEDDSSQTGSVQLVEGTGRVDPDEHKQIVIRKLDSFAVEYHFETVKLLKIDTDGYDFKILRGGFDLISKDKPVLFVEYDPVYLKQQNEPDTRSFTDLKQLGYSKIIYYDNYGKMLLSTTLDNKQQLDQLHNYMSNRDGAFSYYDVCIFHIDDDELAEEVISKEMGLFK